MKEGEREEGTREGAGVCGPHWIRDPQAPRLCSSFLEVRTKEKKEQIGIKRAGDPSVVTGPPSPTPVVWTGKG